MFPEQLICGFAVLYVDTCGITALDFFFCLFFIWDKRNSAEGNVTGLMWIIIPLVTIYYGLGIGETAPPLWSIVISAARRD